MNEARLVEFRKSERREQRQSENVDLEKVETMKKKGEEKEMGNGDEKIVFRVFGVGGDEIVGKCDGEDRKECVREKGSGKGSRDMRILGLLESGSLEVCLL